MLQAEAPPLYPRRWEASSRPPPPGGRRLRLMQFNILADGLSGRDQTGPLGGCSPWRDCHFADALSPSLLIHLLKVEGGAAE